MPETADSRRFRGRWGCRWGCLDGGKNGVDIVGKVLRSVARMALDADTGTLTATVR